MNATRQRLGQLPWHFVEVTEIERIKNQVVAAIEAIGAELDAQADASAWGVLKRIAALPADVFEHARDARRAETRSGLIDDHD